MAALTGRQSLSSADSMMWRIEADPILRSTVLVAGLLDRSPVQARLRATVERAGHVVPGFGEHLVTPPLGVGRPGWAPVERVALDHHIRRVRLNGGGMPEVLALAEPDVMAPFDLERPPWSLTIVDGLDDGAAAFLLRFHHAIADGVGALRLAGTLLDGTRRAPRPERPATPAATANAPADAPAGPPPPEAHLDGPGVAAGLVRAGAVAGRAAAATVTDPVGTARRSARLGTSLWRYLQPQPSSDSPLLVGRGLDRSLHAVEVPLDDLRAAAAACGGTVNDVLLAAVGGAFHTYHRRHGVDVAAMHTSMPINRRAADDPEGGNRFTMTRFVLPVDDPDPMARARAAGALVRRNRAEPALGATGAIVSGLSLLPPAVVARVMGGLLRGTDVNVVDLVGLDRPTFLAGARVDRLWAFAPTAGAACSVTLLSHAGTACVALSSDRAAVADPDVMVACLADALDAVTAGGRS